MPEDPTAVLPKGGQQAAPEDAAPKPKGRPRVGAHVGHYRLLSVLGRGGMGEVFEAEDLSLGRTVALKILKKNDAEWQARMVREARMLAAFDNENIVRVFEVGNDGELVYISMELIRGDPLRDWSDEKKPPLSKVVRLLADIAEVLGQCHEAGIVHRDIKPSNILVRADGRPVLVDFGLATRGEPVDRKSSTSGEGVALSRGTAQSLTEAGTVLGTPGYMAPEQRQGLPGGPRSDQYAFCVTMYEAVFGERPTVEFRKNVPRGPVPSAVPRWLQRVIFRGMAVDPKERWPSMRRLARELRRGLTRRSRLTWAGASAAVLAVAMGVASWAEGFQARRASAACQRAVEARLSSAWGEPFLDTVRTSRGERRGEGMPRGRSSLREYGVDLRAKMRRGCRTSSRAEPEDLRVARQTCMERVLDRSARLVHLGSSEHPPPPEVLARTVALLPEVEGCLNGDSPRVTFPGVHSAPECATRPMVHFVYFVEADQEYDDRRRRDIERQAFALQALWAEQFGGTFLLSDPVVEVVLGAHTSQWYVEQPDAIHHNAAWYRIGNMKNEVFRVLGFRDFDPLHRLVVFPAARVDGHTGAHFGGAWMDGDDVACIHDDSPTYPFDERNPAHCLSHLAHLFGLLSGLQPETGPSSSCMNRGFYLAEGGGAPCKFAEADVKAVMSAKENAGWFINAPGAVCGRAPPREE